MESRYVTLKSNERFQIEGPLGRGGMGEVYAAFDLERNQRVALKSLLAPDAASIYRFKREFRALANVAHPNLVTLYDLVSSGDDWFFTMELVKGTDFLSFVRDLAPPKLDEAEAPSVTRTIVVEPPSSAASSPTDVTEATFASQSSKQALNHGPSEVPTEPAQAAKPERLGPAIAQLAKAITALHRTGHLHRDIKPSNIIVTPEGRVVVLDFGVITELSGSKRKADDAIAGTPAYMAPELLDEVPASPASDWYAYGVILFEALTGTRPFAGSGQSIL